MRFPRFTVADDVRFEGVGLHSGVPVDVRVHPGETGIWFQVGRERVLAKPVNVTETTRCTRLGPVSTIEHLMSALAARGITDADIELSAPELPALDGAALAFLQGLQRVEMKSLGQRETYDLFARVFEKGEHHSIAIATGEGHWRYTFETGARWPGVMTHEIICDEMVYGTEIAPARTFAFEEEVPMIQQAGLAKGLGLENALILGAAGYVNEARFETEPARHKLLDLMGDLYLAGIPITMLNVTAERSGHTANVAAAVKLYVATHGES